MLPQGHKASQQPHKPYALVPPIFQGKLLFLWAYGVMRIRLGERLGFYFILCLSEPVDTQILYQPYCAVA